MSVFETFAAYFGFLGANDEQSFDLNFTSSCSCEFRRNVKESIVSWDSLRRIALQVVFLSDYHF